MLVLKHPSVSYFTQPICLFVFFIYWQRVPLSIVSFKIVLSSFPFLFSFHFFSVFSPCCCQFVFLLLLFFLTPLSLLSSLLLQKGESPKCIYTFNSSPTDSALLAYSFYYYFLLSLNWSFNVISKEPETCHPSALEKGDYRTL